MRDISYRLLGILTKPAWDHIPWRAFRWKILQAIVAAIITLIAPVVILHLTFKTAIFQQDSQGINK